MPAPMYPVNIQTYANPGAGNEFTIINTFGQPVRIRSIHFLLTTSAVVANRTPTINVQDNTLPVTIGRYSSGVAHTATATQEYSFSCDYAGLIGNSAAGIVCVPFPSIILLPNWRARSLTANLDVGDAFTSVSAIFEL